jgi:hypothetical protein
VATETLYATSLTSGTVSSSGNALGAPNATWTSDTGTTSWTARFAIGDPTGGTANGSHTVTVAARKVSGQSGTPVLNSVALYDASGTLIATRTLSTNVTSTSGQNVVATFTESEVRSVANLADLQVQIATTAAGGNPSTRTPVQIESVVWSGDFTASVTATTSLDGVGTLGITASVVGGAITSPATLVGAGTLAVTPQVQEVAAATLAGLGTLAVSGHLSISSSAALTGVGTLAVTGRLSIPTTVALTGAGTLAVTSLFQRVASASLTGVGTLVVTGRQDIPSAPALVGVGTLLAAPDTGTVTVMVGVGTLAVSGRLSISSSATLTGIGALSATALTASVSPATLVGIGALLDASRLSISSTVSLAGLGTLLAAVAHIVVASLDGVGLLSVDGSVSGPVLYPVDPDPATAVIRAFRNALTISGPGATSATVKGTRSVTIQGGASVSVTSTKVGASVDTHE